MKPDCNWKGRKYHGVSLNEYAIILAFLALGTIASLNLLGLSFNELVYNMGHSMSQALGLAEPERPTLTLSDLTRGQNHGATDDTSTSSNSDSGGFASPNGGILAGNAGGSASNGQGGDNNNGTLLSNAEGSGHGAGGDSLIPSWLSGILGNSDTSVPPTTTPPAGLPGSSYYTIKTDSKGQPSLSLTDGTSLGATNVTSVDGFRMTSLGAIQMASQLQGLASGQSNNQFSHYYQAVSNAAYYLGGATGTMDNLPELVRPTIRPNLNGQRRYTNGDALRDINRYKSQLLSLLKNPPKGLPTKDYQQLLTLGVNAYNIGQNYINHFSRFIDAEGYVAQNFVDPAHCQTTEDSACLIGNGLAGSALERADSAAFSSQMPPLSGRVYGDIMNSRKLQTISSQLMQDKVAVALGSPTAAGFTLNAASSKSGHATTQAYPSGEVAALTETASTRGLTQSKGDSTDDNTLNFLAILAGVVLTVVGSLAWQKYGPGKTS
jgi:hypothetical protein